MRTFFISDIHGNLPALEIVFNSIEDNDYVIVLGDVVNYGPWSNECVELLDNHKKKVCIIGNHEKYFLNGFYPHNKGLVNDFFKICYNDFNNLEKLKLYISDFAFNEFNCRHTINDKYIFKDTNIDISKNYIIGHSHQQFKIKINNFTLINPGSVGQNRKNLDIISYCYFDHMNKNFYFKNIEYNSDIIINKMKSLKYPLNCIEYYENKKIK